MDPAPQWYTLSEDKVVVRCQCTLCSDLELLPHNNKNDLPPQLNRRYPELVLGTMKSMKLMIETHDQLKDLVSLQEGLDYEEDCNDSDSGESRCDSEESDSDEFYVDIDSSSSSDNDSE